MYNYVHTITIYDMLYSPRYSLACHTSKSTLYYSVLNEKLPEVIWLLFLLIFLRLELNLTTLVMNRWKHIIQIWEMKTQEWYMWPCKVGQGHYVSPRTCLGISVCILWSTCISWLESFLSSRCIIRNFRLAIWLSPGSYCDVLACQYLKNSLKQLL